jgi:hypothetical protein
MQGDRPVVVMAAMPEAVAVAPAPSSSRAMQVSSAVRVGLAIRE